MGYTPEQPDIFRSVQGIGGDQVFSPQSKHDWVESSFQYAKAHGRIEVLPMTATHTESSINRTRLRQLLIMVILFMGVVFARIMYVQLLEGNSYAALAQGNSQRILPIVAERGLLYDRNGVELTKNIPKFSLALIPQELPKSGASRETIIREIASATGESEDDIFTLLEEYGRYSYESIIIKDDIDYETALSIQIRAADLPGLFIQRGSKRLYLHTTSTPETNQLVHEAQSLSHILGYEGKLSPSELDALYEKGYLPSDDIGKTGIEKEYESLLRGTYGRRRVEVDAIGREQSVLAEEAPIPGNHVQLTIDAELQYMLEESMKKGMKELGEFGEKTRAAGIVSDIKTGEILAMVSLPSFDNNDFSGGIDSETYSSYIQDTDQPLFNRAVGGTYPSGSTLKLAVAAIALDDGIITKNTSFLSNGGLRVSSWFFPDWQAGGHGNTNVTKAIAWSVNTFFYYIGGGYNNFVGLGVDRMNEGLKKYGFSQKLGIDLPGEAAGFIPSRDWKEEVKGERWYIGDTYNMSIGQGDVLVTPLQINSMTSAIANGGTLYAPRLADAIIDPVSGGSYDIESTVVEAAIADPYSLAVVREGMRECVTYGSCRRLSLLPFTTAGKTGTAQWSSLAYDHAWFTSFAPYENPQIAVTILVEEGEGGSSMTAPIAYDFYAKWWNYTQSR